jgi:hypothetical protein
MDMLLAYRIGGTARREIEHQNEPGNEEWHCQQPAESKKSQQQSVQRYSVAKRVYYNTSSAPPSERDHIFGFCGEDLL